MKEKEEKIEKITESEKFAKHIVEEAGYKQMKISDFLYSLRLAEEIVGENIITSGCLVGYEFPSQMRVEGGLM